MGFHKKQAPSKSGTKSNFNGQPVARAWRLVVGLCLLATLYACGSGGSDGGSTGTEPPPPSDRTSPLLLTTSPTNGANDTAIQPTLAAAFNEELKPETLDTASFVVTDASGNPVPGRVSWDKQARLALFTPEPPFAPAAAYTARLTAAITDLAGNQLAPATWTFNTVAPVTAFDETSFWMDESGKEAPVDTDHFRTGKGAILLDTGAAALEQKITSPRAFNFTLGADQSLKLWLYIPQVAEDHQVMLEFRQNGVANYAWTILPALDIDGWYCLTSTRADFHLAGLFNWDKPIDTINVRLTAISPRPNIRVYVDSLWIGGRDFPNAVVTFDDGYKSDYTKVFPIMRTYGMVGTSFVNTGYVDYSFALEKSQMDQLYAAGWEFGNQTATHYGLCEIPPLEWLANLATAAKWLLEKGYLRGMSLLAFPYGEFVTTGREDVDDEILDAGIDAARTAVSFPLETGSGRISSLRYPMTIKLGSATTLNDAKAAIDYAIRFGHSVVICGHEIVDGSAEPYTWNRDDFAALIAYLAEKRDAHALRIPTFGELHAWLVPDS